MRYLQMLNIVPSNQFRRDLKLAKKRGLKLECLTAVINTLAAQKQSKGAVALANIFAGRQPYFLPKMASKSVTVPMPFYKRSSFIDIPFGMPYFKLFYF